MKNISFYTSRGQRYAKIPASSYRENGKIKKRNDGIYLGRVIDEQHHVFYSADRGIFTYDPITGSFGPADQSYVSDLPADQRKRQEICLDFGGSYFLYGLLRSCGYDKVIDAFPYKNKDTLYAMIQYCILRDKANGHAHIWYEGSIAKYLYPKANPVSQRIPDFLKSIGKREVAEQYFESRIARIKENICNGPAILPDSTGMPNNIHFPLTAISSHNGKISREARMTTVVPEGFRIPPHVPYCARQRKRHFRNNEDSQ